MVNPKDNTNPFSDWSDLIDKSVYSIDGRRIGLLRKISSEYMVVSGGLINLSRYFIPKSIAQCVSKKGIRLSITTYEAHTQYSYARTRNFISSLKLVKEENIENRSFYDRFTTLRYTTSNTRNRLAGTIEFISGLLFWLSGYKANLAIYHLVENEARIHAAGELLVLILLPIGIRYYKPAWRDYRHYGSRIICSKQSEYWKIPRNYRNWTRIVHYCFTHWLRNLVW